MINSGIQPKRMFASDKVCFQSVTQTKLSYEFWRLGMRCLNNIYGAFCLLFEAFSSVEWKKSTGTLFNISTFGLNDMKLSKWLNAQFWWAISLMNSTDELSCVQFVHRPFNSKHPAPSCFAAVLMDCDKLMCCRYTEERISSVTLHCAFSLFVCRSIAFHFPRDELTLPCSPLLFFSKAKEQNGGLVKH